MTRFGERLCQRTVSINPIFPTTIRHLREQDFSFEDTFTARALETISRCIPGSHKGYSP